MQRHLSRGLLKTHTHRVGQKGGGFPWCHVQVRASQGAKPREACQGQVQAQESPEAPAREVGFGELLEHTFERGLVVRKSRWMFQPVSLNCFGSRVLVQPSGAGSNSGSNLYLGVLEKQTSPWQRSAQVEKTRVFMTAS